MSRPCDVAASGAIELYFYDELDPVDRVGFERHLAACDACRDALDQLRLIRSALAARPDVSSPPAGDWSAFMSRLNTRIESADRYSADRLSGRSTHRSAGLPTDRSTDPPIYRSPGLPTYRGYLAMAALLALVTMSVLSIVRWGPAASVPEAQDQAVRQAEASPAGQDQRNQGSPRAALADASEHHLERSKLVLLGLATKDASDEWIYERELASNLLSDTRLYRQAAEERGMEGLAGVLRDLELVLLQASLTESDPEALGQIQRLIRKRDLLEKMKVVTTSGT